MPKDLKLLDILILNKFKKINLPKFTKDLLWQFIGPVVKQLRGLILIPIITKLIGIENYSQ